MTDPRDPHRAEREAEKQRRYRDSMQELDTPNADHLETQAITDCPLCDDHGYRGHHVCDHRDHATASQHGRGLAQAELAKIRQRKADRARGGAA